MLSIEELPPRLTTMVVEKLDAAGILRMIRLRPLKENPLQLTGRTALLIEFPGLGTKPQYRMLVCFQPQSLLDTTVQNKIRRTLELHPADMGVFWTTEAYSSIDVQALKRIAIDPMCVPLDDKLASHSHRIPDFIYLRDMNHEAVLQLNLLANEVVKRLRKKFHLVLSEVAAAEYDGYGTFATKSVMTFEDELLASTLDDFLGAQRKGRLALDVGCGDGRHSRPLARRFDSVVAFDLSKAMTDAAKRKDRADPRSYTNITYYENDFEYEEFPEEADLAGKADFICASFGMPSFVEDTVGMLRRFHRWLRPQGVALLTFYNADSLALRLNSPWKEQGLSAALDLQRNALAVKLSDDVAFSIYCRAFDQRVMEMVKGTFEVLRFMSYPHLMSILPPSIFGTADSPNEGAQRICPELDRALANEGFPHGHYAFLVLKKGEPPVAGYLAVLGFLDSRGIQPEVLQHQPVISTREVQGVLGLKPAQMVKTVVFYSGVSERVAVILQADRHVDSQRLVKAAGLQSSVLALAPPADILRDFGFPIGGIAPFGFPAHVKVVVDQAVLGIQEEFVFMGVGDNTKTLKLRREDFLALMHDYRAADVSSAVPKRHN